jgi:hypothetical protein
LQTTALGPSTVRYPVLRFLIETRPTLSRIARLVFGSSCPAAAFIAFQSGHLKKINGIGTFNER